MLTKEQYLQICAMEEAAEVTQRLSKALRFGLDEVQPGQSLDNRQRLEGEIIDLVAVLMKLEEVDAINLQRPEQEEALHDKLDKIAKYMAYSRDQGLLEA